MASATASGGDQPAQGYANRILATLTAEDMAAVRPHLTRARLNPGDVLARSGEPSAMVHFIESGLVFLAASGTASIDVHLAMIGREGAVGLDELVCGSGTAFASAVVQTGGWAQQAPLGALVQGAAGLRAGCVLPLQGLMRQVMETSVSHARHSLLQRCARWLALAQERLVVSDVGVTHEALAAALGVRRSGVTVATAALQARGLIRAGRGRVRIVDRAGLRRVAAGGLKGLDGDPDACAEGGLGGAIEQ